ncbi:MAG TPA: hypothetical protein VKE95_15940 [Burkholderiales bacterium]|nr:hypothetical protein [Burkholderiales bacterium]
MTRAALAEVRAASGDPLGKLSSLVSAAHAGDATAAREILRVVCTSIKIGHPLPEPLATYLHGAFSSYLRGDEPLMERALNLVQASRPPETNARVPVQIKRLRRIRVKGCGIRTSPVAANIEGTRRQSYLVARIYLRMKLHLMSKGEAASWVSRRYRIPEERLQAFDADLDAIGGWTVAQLKSLIRLAK